MSLTGSFKLRFVVGWLVVLRINVDLAIFQPYLDLEAGDNQSLKIQVARSGIEPRSSCSASQELNHSATAAPNFVSSVSDKFDPTLTCASHIYWPIEILKLWQIFSNECHWSRDRKMASVSRLFRGFLGRFSINIRIEVHFLFALENGSHVDLG